MAASRFAQTSAEERDKKRMQINSKKTLKANKGAAKIFKDYLQVQGESKNFEEFDNAKLDEMLGRFYMDLRREDGTYYKVNSMETIRHGISRYLKSPPFNRKIDIVKDSLFIESNTCFKAVLAEAKRLGMVEVHHPIISDTDLSLLYTSNNLSIATPRGLFNKVQFDIRMFFCRRGIENMHTMTKNTFRVEIDENTGRKVVTKNLNDFTENCHVNKEASSGIMPEIQGSKYCPVLSFEMYLSKLHPNCDKLWQRPKENITDSESVWYCNLPVGEKKLSTFFSSLSRATNLSRVYSNQSIRVTGASIQSKCMHDSQTMTGAGHLPVQSISEYVLRRVSDTQIIQPLCVNPVPTPRLLIFSRVDRPTIIAGSTTTWETSQIEAAATHSEAQIMECDPTSIKTEPPFTDYDAQLTAYRETMDSLVQRTLEAHGRIQQYIYKTPLTYSIPLSKQSIDCKVFIKLESEQLTGSFKIRGAFNKLLKLSSAGDVVKHSGIITASSGNHGMACVEAGGTLGIPVTVYCQRGVDEHKKQALLDRGVRVVLHGNDCVEAENEARAAAMREQKEYVSPYNDVDVIAGQGTIGKEILESCPDVDCILVPVGGGGLISGIARYVKQVRPSVEIIGCQPQNSKVMFESVKAGRIVLEESLDTLSEGTAGGVEENSITFPLCAEYVDDWILVDEEEIGKAIIFMLQHHHKVVEGAAGMTLGAYMKNPERFSGKKVVVVACGGNIGIDKLKHLLSLYT